MSNTTKAQATRNAHLDTAEADLRRALAALQTLRANTENLADWGWVGDINYLATQTTELVKLADRMAVQSTK